MSTKSNSTSCFDLVSRYKGLVRIGQGAFGSVFVGEDVKTNSKRALKVIKFNNYEDLNTSMKEGSNLMNIKHENILRVTDFFVDPKDQVLCIEMDFYEHGDLLTFSTSNVVYSEKLVRGIIYQLCDALNFIHTNLNIIHRDIKPSNIFLKEFDPNNDKVHVVLADFGLAKHNQGSVNNSYAGTPLFMSPELGLGGKYDSSTDIYSLGVSIYQILTKDVVTSISQLYLYQDVGEVQEKLRNEINTKSDHKYSSELVETVLSMLEKDPRKRPTAKQIMDIMANDLIVMG